MGISRRKFRNIFKFFLGVFRNKFLKRKFLIFLVKSDGIALPSLPLSLRRKLSVGFIDGCFPSVIPLDSIGLRRNIFCDELNPDETFCIVFSVGGPFSRQNNDLFHR